MQKFTFILCVKMDEKKTYVTVKHEFFCCWNSIFQIDDDYEDLQSDVYNWW